MRTKYKPWAKPYIEEHTEVMCPFDNINNYKNYYLEIGSGKGQFLVNMAKNHPGNLFIGMERNVTCAGFTAKKLVEGEITNAKLVYADAGQVLPSIEAESVEGIFLNFSDPWPKKRHAKRRLTSDSFLGQYYRILKKVQNSSLKPIIMTYLLTHLRYLKTQHSNSLRLTIHMTGKILLMK